MKHLALGQAAVARMDGCDRRPVLLLGPTCELMHDAIGHLGAPLRRTTGCIPAPPAPLRDPTAPPSTLRARLPLRDGKSQRKASGRLQLMSILAVVGSRRVSRTEVL